MVQMNAHVAVYLGMISPFQECVYFTFGTCLFTQITANTATIFCLFTYVNNSQHFLYLPTILVRSTLCDFLFITRMFPVATKRSVPVLMLEQTAIPNSKLDSVGIASSLKIDSCEERCHKLLDCTIRILGLSKNAS